MSLSQALNQFAQNLGRYLWFFGFFALHISMLNKALVLPPCTFSCRLTTIPMHQEWRMIIEGTHGR